MTDTLKFIQKHLKYNPSQPLPVQWSMSRFNGFPKLLNALGFKTGAEIGVATGFFSQFLCKYIPGLKLYCIDPWEAYPEYIEHHDLPGQIILNTCMETAKQRLASYNSEFIRKYSMDAVKSFLDNSLDFVFIDGNHSFRYVTDDIAEWSKKVRPGGIVAGHDYWNSSESKMTYVKNLTPEEKIRLCQVKEVVQAWTKAYQINPWFVINKDRCPSFFWVKT